MIVYERDSKVKLRRTGFIEEVDFRVPVSGFKLKPR